MKEKVAAWPQLLNPLPLLNTYFFYRRTGSEKVSSTY